MRIRVISLPSALERRRKMTEHFSSSRDAWSFFDACTGEPVEYLVYEPRRAIRTTGRELSQSERGVFQSHYTLWRELIAADDGPEWQCVLEDDTFLDLSFDLDGFARLLDGCNVIFCRLYFTYMQPTILLGDVGQRTLIRFPTGPAGAQAYLISRTAARRLVTGMRSMERPIDVEYDRFWVYKVPIHGIFPCPAIDLGLGSPMADRSHVKSLQGPLHRLALLHDRIRDKAAKELENMRLTAHDSAVRRSLRELRGSGLRAGLGTV